LPTALVVGGHRLEVRERSAAAVLDLLGEEASELRTEFQAMTNVVENDLPRVRGPFWYLTPERRFARAINPWRIATFVLDHTAGIESAVRRLESSPARRTRYVRRVQPTGALIDVGATRALARSRPELMEEHPAGVVAAAGRRWSPRLVVARHPVRDVSTLENRRLLAFLGRLWRDAETSAAQLDDAELREELAGAQATLSSLMHDTFLREVQGLEGDDSVLEPVGLESSELDYAHLHALRTVYLTATSPGADTPELERQRTARADEIFQAFGCYVIAAAFELLPVGDGLRDRDSAGVSFRGPEWELLYDIGGAVSSWRTPTAQPDDYRPDIVLRRVRNHCRVILLDAKYSVSTDTGRPPNERLKEVQAYMQSFRIPRIGILFPGKADDAVDAVPHDVSGGGFLIRALPVRGSAFDVVRTLPILHRRVLELEAEVPETA
jgi:hypothetical protein